MEAKYTEVVEKRFCAFPCLAVTDHKNLFLSLGTVLRRALQAECLVCGRVDYLVAFPRKVAMLRDAVKFLRDFKPVPAHLVGASQAEIEAWRLQLFEKEKAARGAAPCDDGLCLLKACPRCGPDMIADGVVRGA